MQRPIYETAQNTAREMAVAQRAAQAWNARAVKLKTAYAVDYALLRDGRTKAFAECKCRTYPMGALDAMGGFMLSLHKWAAMKALAWASGLPVLLVVECADGLWFHKPTDFSHDGIGYSGRTDRNDPQDVEPVILLRQQRFTFLPCRQPAPVS